MILEKTFKSSSSDAKYTAQRDSVSGMSSCTCPGWTRRVVNGVRSCKHTKELDALAVSSAPVEVADETDAEGMPHPMLARALDDVKFEYFIGHADWRLEEKFDGHRVLVRVDGEVTAFSRPRDGRMLRKSLPPYLVAALRALPPGIYDGELVAGERSTDVTRVDKRDGQRVILFDVLALGDATTLHLPYVERAALLEQARAHVFFGVEGAPSLVKLSTSEPVTQAALDAIWARGGEGVILKHVASKYRPGARSADWVKVKRRSAATTTIVGFKAGKLGPFSRTEVRMPSGVLTVVKTLDNATLRDIEKRGPDAFIGRELVISFESLLPSGKPHHPMWDHLL